MTRVRLIVEGDPHDILPLLNAMPGRVRDWHLGPANYQPEARPQSVRAQVIAALPVPKRTKAHRYSYTRMTPAEVTEFRNGLTEFLLLPSRWAGVMTFGTSRGRSKSFTHRIISGLVDSGLVTKTDGIYQAAGTPLDTLRPARRAAAARMDMIRESMVNHVASNPGCGWSDLMKVAMKLGVTRSHASSTIRVLRRDGRITPDYQVPVAKEPNHAKS
jgi:hypothetical protein